MKGFIVCDVCRSEEQNWAFLNGEKARKLTSVKFYRVYEGREAKAIVCYLHAIELFTSGESRFMRAHLSFARFLAARARRHYEEENDFDFAAY